MPKSATRDATCLGPRLFILVSSSNILGKKCSNVGIPISLVVGNDLDLAMLEDTHARVGGSEIDTDSGLLGHCDGVFDEKWELEGAVNNL